MSVVFFARTLKTASFPTPLVRIGVTQYTAKQRVEAIQLGMPFRLHLVVSIEAYRDFETFLLNKFAPQQVRLQWFLWEGRLAEYLAGDELLEDAKNYRIADRVSEKEWRVRTMLADPTWAARSTAWVAKELGMSRKFVGRVRAEISGTPRAVVGMDGVEQSFKKAAAAV